MPEGPAEKGTGALYIVATPIGNLEDITLRALRILRTVGLIAAEDTRRTKVLLRAYEISTPLTSLYDQIELKKSEALVAKLKSGIDVAYVSDAGTPGISDPGFILINEALAHGIPVVPVPGVSAVIAALCVSGLPMHAFMFRSFLPAKASQRQAVLKSHAAETSTLIFYESPNRLLASLRDIRTLFGNRRIVVARELTKLFEEILRGRVDDVMEILKERKLKGEITLVIAGREEALPTYSDEDIRCRLENLEKSTNLSLREGVDRVTLETGLSRRRVYQLALKTIERKRGD